MLLGDFAPAERADLNGERRRCFVPGDAAAAGEPPRLGEPRCAEFFRARPLRSGGVCCCCCCCCCRCCRCWLEERGAAGDAEEMEGDPAAGEKRSAIRLRRASCRRAEAGDGPSRCCDAWRSSASRRFLRLGLGLTLALPLALRPLGCDDGDG
jgi:hypothetical protein